MKRRFSFLSVVLLVANALFPAQLAHAASVLWSVETPFDTYNRADLNPNYDIEEVSAAIWDDEPDLLYFYLWFKNVPTANMFNDGRGSWAAVRIDTDLDDEDDYRLTITQTTLRTDRSPVFGYVYSFLSQSRIDCEVKVFTNIQEQKKYVGFAFPKACLGLTGSFGFNGYADYIANDSTSFDYAPDDSYIATLPGGSAPPKSTSGGTSVASQGTYYSAPSNVKNLSVEATSYSSPPGNLTALSKALLPSVVTIGCANGKGTGWSGAIQLSQALATAGFKSYIFTNHHVVEDCIASKKVTVTLSSGEILSGEVAAWDESRDVAAVVVKTEIPTLQWIGKNPEQGWWVGVLGSPLGTSNVLTTGIVSSVNTSSKQFTMTAAINPGNSGGPVFDSMGRVIGLATAKRVLSSGELAEGFGIAHGTPLLCTTIVDCTVEKDPWNAIPNSKQGPSAEELAAAAKAQAESEAKLKAEAEAKIKAEAEAKERAEAEAKLKADLESALKAQKALLCKDFNGDLQQTDLKLKLAIATYPKSNATLKGLQALIPMQLDCENISPTNFDSDLMNQRKLLTTFQSSIDSAVAEAQRIATAASKKTTITCVKGSLTKKVTGKNPKCPAGYRKK